MKLKVLVISILLLILTSILYLGTILSPDENFIASLLPDPVANVIISNPNPCDLENKSEIFEQTCRNNTGVISNEEFIGEKQVPVNSTTSKEEVEQKVEEIKNIENDNVENKNGSAINFGDFDFEEANADLKDVEVYYNDDSEMPIGFEPNVENLELYSNLFIYDYYEGDITSDDSRVYVDNSKYDSSLEQTQTVYVNVIEPSGRMTEYPMMLNTVVDTNQFDKTAPVISIDSTDVKLTDKQFKSSSDSDLILLLVEKYNFSIIDDYDGDITHTADLEIQRIENSVFDSSGSKYQLYLKVFDQKYNFSKMILNVSIVPPVDEDVPVISGNNSIELYNEKVELTDFERLGIAAYDKSEGDVTNRITVTDDGGYVPGVVGNYTVNYGVKDSEGNATNFYKYEIHVGETIQTCDDLNVISGGLNLYYKQVNDIDCAGVSVESIGSKFNTFEGGYDGDGYIIDNLKIGSDNDGYSGLFATSSGVIKNVHLTNVDVQGSTTVGGLVSYNSGDVYNSSVTGNIISKGSVSKVGGLIGYNTGTVSNVYTDVEVTGYYEVGGLIGYSMFGTVNNALVNASLEGVDGIARTADNAAGGLIGTGSSNKINNVITVSEIRDDYFNSYAGIVGESKTDKISNSYVSISGKAIDVAGYVAGLNNGSNLLNNYFAPSSNVSATNVVGDSKEQKLIGEDFNEILFTQPVDKSSWEISEIGLPKVKYIDANGFGTENVLRGQGEMSYKDPNIGDENILPEIIGNDFIEVDITTKIDITNTTEMGIQAFDSENVDITGSIQMINAGGFKNNKAGEYDVTYQVVDDFGRVSDPFIVTVKIIDTVPPTLVGPTELSIYKNEILNYQDPYTMQLVSYDQEDLFTNNIKVIDNDGFKGDGTDIVGNYDIAYQVEDDSGNKSPIHIISIEVLDTTKNINTCMDLQSIGKGPDYKGTTHEGEDFPSDGTYVITEDLDCSTKENSQSIYFDPIVLSDGVYIDGQNHTVSGVTLQEGGSTTAMISKVGDAIIKNIIIADAKVVGEDYTSVLIGEVDGNVNIENVTVSADVKGSLFTSFLIGKVNKDSSVSIEKTAVEGRIEGIEFTGILVADLEGDLETKLNRIDVDYAQVEDTTFELVGAAPHYSDSDEYVALVEHLMTTNFIQINKYYIDSDGNTISDDERIEIAPTIEEEDVKNEEDDMTTETDGTIDPNVDNLDLEEDASSTDIKEDDPIPDEV